MKKTKQKAATKTAKSNKKKWIFLGVGVAAVGALSYFGWTYFKSRKEETETPVNALPDFSAHLPPKPANTSTYTPPKTTTYSTASSTQTSSGFPLKKGSRGEKVKQLQLALIAAHGKSILPTYGADGDFGTETVNALKKLSLPLIIDETTFNVLVKTASVNPADLAKKLYDATQSKSFTSATTLLKTIKSTADYSAVSEAFKKYNINGVSQTLVNGMLNTFTTESQKQELRLIFAGMGLKYNGEKWTLSGFGAEQLLITRIPTRIWVNPRESVAVPKKMVLGRLIESRSNHTLFENEGQYFIVESSHVDFYR